MLVTKTGLTAGCQINFILALKPNKPREKYTVTVNTSLCMRFKHECELNDMSHDFLINV